ncbi:MAG: hypothetical protein V7K14_18335 [Nostoc sp.]|uniref:hypothetical protein n=1 Tax=Nostoc sp. TaxID=1180 RepID=UPI002FF8B6A2
MYFNAFLAKTLLAFSGELGIRRDAINRVCTGVRSLLFPPCPMPNAPCPILLYETLPERSVQLPNAPLWRSLTFDLNRWTFKNIMKVYLSVLVLIS